ncbi:hypothetical protein [Halomonas sp.]|uniref:hypothetical protein n=1 Tax=Halomonas sp. TaxID=1486246 RepID=UPI00384EF0AC
MQAQIALPKPYDLLGMAWPEVATCAQQVGIDADALRYSLPTPGTLLTGNHVPVVAAPYRGKCSVLLHINRMSGGDEWPFLRFYTFKQGGQHCDFNGLRWWQQVGRDGEVPAPGNPVFSEAYELGRQRESDMQRWRQANYRRWGQHWTNALPVDPWHPWIRHRLMELATPALMHRVALRSYDAAGGETLMAPLERVGSAGHVGYQLLSLMPQLGETEKRTCIPQAGASRGAFIRICAAGDSAQGKAPIAICEGLATGLSLALVWRGEIRVALCADNLSAVRRGIPGPVTLFHDHDIWKPAVGNVGRQGALAAMRPGDCLHGPGFHPESDEAKPTDYNDLLWLEGPEALYRQVWRAWEYRNG